MTDYEIEQRFAEMRTQIVELQNLISELLPASQLPAMASISADGTAKIVKLRADLFHNGRGKGKVEWRIKLFVWFDHKRSKQGHIKPLTFDMARAGGLDIRPYETSLFAETARQCYDTDARVGCLTHRSPGTVKHKDHVALLHGNMHRLSIGIGDWVVELPEYEAVESEKKNSPVARWYWNKE